MAALPYLARPHAAADSRPGLAQGAASLGLEPDLWWEKRLILRVINPMKHLTLMVICVIYPIKHLIFMVIYPNVRRMKEILHHLGWLKLYLGIDHLSNGAGFLPTTVR